MNGFRLWQIAGWTMLHYFWVGMALGISALLVRRKLRSATAVVRYWFAVGSLLLLSAAPAAIAVVVTKNIPPVPRHEPLAMKSAIRPEAMPFDVKQPAMAAAEISTHSMPGDHPADLPVKSMENHGNKRLQAALNSAAMYLPWLWVIGAPLSFALTTVGLFGAERLRRQSRPLEDARITDLCRKLASSLRISFRVGVATCDRIAGPILLGVLRPVILLPTAALAGWDPQQLEMVLLHELAHVRRYDNLVNLLQRIVESLLFFQPFVWIISDWVRREREHCCDELVVARTRQPCAYAEILLALAESISRNPARVSPLMHSPASSIAERPLVARIHNILKKEEQAMQVSRKAIGLMFLCFFAVSTMIGGYFSLPSRAEDSPAASPNDKARAIDAPAPGTPAEASAPIPPELQKPIIGKNYLIIPLLAMTELQKNLRWDAADAKLFVVINGRALLDDKDEHLDASAFDYSGFLEDLYKYKKAGVKGRILAEIDGVPRDEPVDWESLVAYRKAKHPLRASQALWGLLSHEANVIGPIEIRYGINREEKNAKEWKTLVDELTALPTEEEIRGEDGIGDGLMAVHAIRTPLSRYWTNQLANCVIRNVKSLSDLTPEETAGLFERAKPLFDKLKLKEPPRAAFVVAYGDSRSRFRRVEHQLHLSDSAAVKKAIGADVRITIMKDAGRPARVQKLLVRVLGEDGSPINEAKVTAAFPPETQELFEHDRMTFFKEKDGRWCCYLALYDEEFILTAAADGYEPSSQKFKLPFGATKELDVKLKRAAPNENEPSEKTSADKPEGEKKQAADLTYQCRLIDHETGAPIADATVSALRRVSNRAIPFQNWKKLGETNHKTDAEGRYTVTVPPDQAAEGGLYIEITADHPNYVRYYGGYSFGMILRNEKLGERPFFEKIELVPMEKISGSVVTPEGKPAAGVLVKSFSMSKNNNFEHSSWVDVKTDAAGFFEIKAVKGGEAVFWILPKDYAPSTQMAGTKRGDLGRFVLEKGIVLKGRVLDADGKPLPSVWVNADIRGGKAKKEIMSQVYDHLTRSALSGETGEFALPPLPDGEYSLSVFDEPRGGLVEDATVHPVPAVFISNRITIDSDQPPEPVEIRAVPHVTISGRFVDSAGNQTSGHVPHLSGETEPPPEAFWGTEMKNDEQGRFTAKAPKGFKLRMQLVENEHHASRTRVSKDGPLMNGSNVELGTPERDMSDIEVVRFSSPILLVKVVDEDGKPIKEFLPKIKYSSDWPHKDEYLKNDKPTGNVGFEIQNDGRWRTTQLLPDEDFVLTVEAEGYEMKSEKLKLPEGDVKELEVQLAKKSTDK